MGSVDCGLPLRQFEGQQDPAANFQCVLNGLQARRQRGPFVVSEVGMGCARRYDQVVESDILVFQLNQAPLQIEILHLTQEHLHIASAAQNPADRSSNFPGRQSGCCDLVKKRLEGVMISAINEQDLH